MKRVLVYTLILAGLGVLLMFRPVILGQGGIHGVYAADEQEIERLIERAVGSVDYTDASDRAELEDFMRQIYTEPALTRVTDAVWNEWHTDNAGPAQILRWTGFVVDGHRARVAADLYFRDWTDNAEFYGTGRWDLVRTEAGWRITNYDYRWGY